MGENSRGQVKEGVFSLLIGVREDIRRLCEDHVKYALKRSLALVGFPRCINVTTHDTVEVAAGETLTI